MRRYTTYLSYVCRHKYYVFLACFKLGIPWLGVVHDLSKLSRAEFIPYAKNFFNPDGSRRLIRDATGAYDPNSQSNAFQVAWLSHQKNKHHWQAWISIGDGGRMNALEMPIKYCLEMIADWTGAGMAINGISDCRPWYEKNKRNMLLHPRSQEFVETHLGIR